MFIFNFFRKELKFLRLFHESDFVENDFYESRGTFIGNIFPTILSEVY